MNKFKKLAANLIKNKLWCSKIFYKKTEAKSKGVGLPVEYVDIETISLNVVIRNVSKNLIDNVNIFSTDKSFVVDALTIIPKAEDYVIINNIKHKIVYIQPLGELSNEPTAYEITMRVA